MLYEVITHLIRQVVAEIGFIQGNPEGKNGLDKADNQVTRLHMGLFTQKMDEYILALVDLIELGGNIAQLALGADLVEEDRHQFGELFRQVVDRTNGMVEQVGDVALEQVCVAHAGTGEPQVDDQGREQGRAPLGLLGDQVKPDPDA